MVGRGAGGGTGSSATSWAALSANGRVVGCLTSPEEKGGRLKRRGLPERPSALLGVTGELPEQCSRGEASLPASLTRVNQAQVHHTFSLRTASRLQLPSVLIIDLEVIARGKLIWIE